MNNQIKKLTRYEQDGDLMFQSNEGKFVLYSDLVKLINDSPVVYASENNVESAWFRNTDNKPEKVDTNKASLLFIEQLENKGSNESSNI